MRFLMAISLILLVGIAAAQTILPSDIVKSFGKARAIEGPIQLSGTHPDAARYLSIINEPLDAWNPMVMPNYGQFFSDYNIENAFDVVINENGVPEYLFKYAKEIPPIPASVKGPGLGKPINFSEIVYL